MRVLFAVALTLATAMAAAAQTVHQPADHSSDLARLFGTWTCEDSLPGNTSVEVYAPAIDGSIALESRVRASTGRAGIVAETFRFDAMSESWTLSAGANAFFGGLNLRAPAWNEPTWVFDGSEIVSGRARPVRIVYTDLGALGFRREHQTRSRSAWQDDAQLLCRRDGSPPAAGASPAAPADVSWKFAAPPSRTAPAPRDAPAPESHDRAYDLVGSWSCETLARDPGVHRYSLQNDGSLALHNRLKLGTQTFQIDEVYRYDSLRQRWTNDTAHGAYRGSAARWAGDEWVFDGIATERGKSTAVHMVYEALGATAFRRDFQKRIGPAWTTYASETCSRDGARLP